MSYFTFTCYFTAIFMFAICFFKHIKHNSYSLILDLAYTVFYLYSLILAILPHFASLFFSFYCFCTVCLHITVEKQLCMVIPKVLEWMWSPTVIFCVISTRCLWVLPGNQVLSWNCPNLPRLCILAMHGHMRTGPGILLCNILSLGSGSRRALLLDLVHSYTYPKVVDIWAFQLRWRVSYMILMRFLGWQWGSWGLEPMAKKEFLKTSLVQKGDFMKAQGQDPWAGRTTLGLWKVAPYRLCGSGGGKVKREVFKEIFIC